VYNLLPDGVSKATAVVADLAARGLSREHAVAVGDATSDLALAPHVAGVFIVANGAHAVERAAEVPGLVYLTDSGYGEGFAESVRALLA
jgi:hydroxymethylpyrimidine pyrophosphatase-like HAD family hydrolase